MKNEIINIIINFNSNKIDSNEILENLLPNYNGRNFHLLKNNEIILEGNMINISEYPENKINKELNFKLSIDYDIKKLDFDLWLMSLQDKTQNYCINKLGGKINKINIIHNGVSICIVNL